ncbi:hypothetical protein N7507_007232 [Penicillium longicatenatum]|nr:hypothetical protein N7507_007232 [Penicillium longicatenatum]
MTDAKVDLNQSRRKVAGSLNSVQLEIGVLYQMYESLQSQHAEAEADLKRAQERIQLLEAEDESNATRVMQIIKLGKIDDDLLSTRLNKIYDSLEDWPCAVVPFETDLSRKRFLISLYLSKYDLLQPGIDTFNRHLKGTNAELISAIIMAILSKTLFLNVVADAVSIRLWKVEVLRAWMQSPNFPAHFSAGCLHILSIIKDFFRKVINIQGDLWDERFDRLLDNVVTPAAQLATEIQSSGTEYQLTWDRFRPTAGLKLLEECQVTDFQTRHQVKEELVRDLSENTPLGAFVLTTLPGLYRLNQETGERSLLVKFRVLVKSNNAIP